MNLTLRPKPKPVKEKKVKPMSSMSRDTLPASERAAIFHEFKYKCACGCDERAEDLHHCLFGRRTDFPELDAKENRVPLTHYQNITREFDNIDGRKMFWAMQCKRYGKPHMIAWLRALPPKIKNTRLDFLTPSEKAEVMA